MQIAIGLPGLIPGVDGPTMIEWARRAEQRNFHSVVIDERLLWKGYDSLVAATAAATATQRIRVVVAVVVAPLRRNVPVFAKQVTSIDRLSGGRFVLGIGVGGKEDDFALSKVDYHQRGRLTDQLLEEAQALWRGDVSNFGPEPTAADGPSIVFGGASDAAFRRVARFGSGWVCATSGGPQGVRTGIDKIGGEWRAAARSGSPRIFALSPRFALGANGREAVDSYVLSYNAYRGADAGQRAATALLNADDVQNCIATFTDAGCDELIIHPADPDPYQVDLLADAIGTDYLRAP